MSYELLLTARVMIYSLHTTYELFLLHMLQVSIYCTSYMCNVDCVKFLCYIKHSFYDLYLIKSSIPSQLFLSNICHDLVTQRLIIISYSLKCKMYQLYHLFISMTYSPQNQVLQVSHS